MILLRFDHPTRCVLSTSYRYARYANFFGAQSAICSLQCLLPFFQGWLRKHEKQQVSHGQAIAYLLKTIDVRKWDTGFERDVIVTMSAPVVCDYSLTLDNDLLHDQAH